MKIFDEYCSTCNLRFYCGGINECLDYDEDLWLYGAGADLYNNDNLPANNWW